MQKKKRIVNKKYKDWIKQLPCEISGKQAEPHHCNRVGHGSIGSKTDDTRCIPLSHVLHAELHQTGRTTFAVKYNISYEEIITRLNSIWEEAHETIHGRH